MTNIVRLRIFKELSKRVARFIVSHRSIDILLLVILAIIGYRGWFKPGMLDYGDLWPYPREEALKFFAHPYIWYSSPSLGEYFPSIYFYPHQFWFCGLLTSLGFGFSICQRLAYYFPFLIFSIFSMYYFSYVLFKKRIICFFATVFFVFNTFILGLLQGGIVVSAVAQALAPLVLAFFIKGLQEKQLKNAVLSGLFLSLSIAYYPPDAYLTIGAIFLFFIGNLIGFLRNCNEFARTRIIKLVGYFILVLIIPVILHFYWVLPSILVKSALFSAGHTSAETARACSYAKLSHAICGYNVFWPPGSSGVQTVGLPYFIVPLFVFIGILSRFKDKNVRLLAIIAAISVFFAKGTNKPFGEIYIWFFKYVPLGNMFRTPGKFHCLINLSYAPLLGIGVAYLADALKTFELKKIRRQGKATILKPLFIIFVFCFMMFLVFPALAGKMGGTFEPKKIPQEYSVIEKFIKSQPPYFRTFWRPIIGRYAFFSFEHPLISAELHSDSRFNLGYLLNESFNPKAFIQTKDIAKILGILSVKHCFLPIEEEYVPLSKKEYYIKTFEEQRGFKRIDIGKNIVVFENQYVTPAFYATNDAALLVGSQRGLLELASLNNLDFSKWAVYLSDEQRERNLQLLRNFKTVVFCDREIDDLVLASVSNEYRFDLANYAIRSDDPTPGKYQRVGLFPSDIYSPEFGELVYSKVGCIYGHVLVESDLAKPLMVDVSQPEIYEVWVRATTGPTRGKLSIWKSRDAKNYAYTYWEDFEGPANWEKRVYKYSGLQKFCLGGPYGLSLKGYDEKGKNTGEIIYKIETASPLKLVWMELDTVDLNGSHIGRFFISSDCKNWIQVSNDRKTDMHPGQERVDFTNFARGQKKCFIKFQLENKVETGSSKIDKVRYHYETISTEEILKDRDLKEAEEIPRFKWVKSDPVYLDKGKNYFQIINRDGLATLDQAVVIPSRVISALQKDVEGLLQTKDIVIIKSCNSLISEVFIPEKGKYSVAADVMTVDFSGKLGLLLEDRNIKEINVQNRKERFWMETEPVELNKGISLIRPFKEGQGKAKLKRLILYKTNKSADSIENFFASAESIPVVWQQINPTKYKVKLKTDKLAYLVFSEGFDPGWTLNLKEPVQSISAYSMINSFFIKSPGEVDATLEFVPQRYMYKGFLISVTALILMILYLICEPIISKRNRKLKAKK